MAWNPIHKHLEKDVYPASQDVESFKKWAVNHKIRFVGVYNPEDRKSPFCCSSRLFDHVRIYRSEDGTQYLTAHIYKSSFFGIMDENGLLDRIGKWAEEKNLDAEAIPSWYYPEECIGIVASTRRQ